jgi:homoserine dehydrogenase
VRKPIGIAVLGLGNVGTEVVRIIEESAADLEAASGAAAAARRRRAPGGRRPRVPVELLTDDIDAWCPATTSTSSWS